MFRTDDRSERPVSEERRMELLGASIAHNPATVAKVAKDKTLKTLSPDRRKELLMASPAGVAVLDAEAKAEADAEAKAKKKA